MYKILTMNYQDATFHLEQIALSEKIIYLLKLYIEIHTLYLSFEIFFGPFYRPGIA